MVDKTAPPLFSLFSLSSALTLALGLSSRGDSTTKTREADETRIAELERRIEAPERFSSKREYPEISFSSSGAASGRIVSVADNRIGFEMPHAEAVFQPFHRLHRESEYEGTEVGLATVRKMVRRYGSEIEVESEAGVGTTFRFTLDGSRCAVDSTGPTPLYRARSETLLHEIERRPPALASARTKDPPRGYLQLLLLRHRQTQGRISN